MLMKQSQVVAVSYTVIRPFLGEEWKLLGQQTFCQEDVLSGRRFVRTDLDVLSGPPYTLCQEDILAGPSLSFFLQDMLLFAATF